MAAAGFRIRKVKTDQSIGDKLKKARVRRKINVADVEEATRIRAKYILALEGDSWDQLPSEVYGRGYLESYLEFLRLSKSDIMKQYDRERLLFNQNSQEKTLEFKSKNRLYLPKFVLTPRVVMIMVIIAFVVGITGLVGLQLKKFTSAPFLEVITPVEASGIEGELFVTASQININGKTVAGAKVEVNGESVPVDNEGVFNGMVNLQKGLNSIIVTATSHNGKTSTDVMSVTVK